jgi:ATP-dependent Clp protease ATP-binding subunit ClpA
MAGFDKYLKAMLDQAGIEARQDGSATAEAQHLLLAIAADPAGSPARVLTAAGLDHDTIRAALRREFEQSLNVAGVSAAAFDLPPATPDPDRTPQPGASIQLALERCLKAGGRRHIQPAHLLLGVLLAEVGTVPRALAIAGVNRAALLASVLETVD